MRKYIRSILIGIACLVFIAPISFTLGAKPAGAASTIVTSCRATPSGKWPMYGYNVAGTRYNNSEKILNTANVRTLVEDWSFPTGNYEQSSAAIANGVVYIGILGWLSLRAELEYRSIALVILCRERIVSSVRQQ